MQRPACRVAHLLVCIRALRPPPQANAGVFRRRQDHVFSQRVEGQVKYPVAMPVSLAQRPGFAAGKAYRLADEARHGVPVAYVYVISFRNCLDRAYNDVL